MNNTKGQGTIFITLGLLILITAILIYVALNYSDSNDNENLAKIENLDQAAEAVESCMSDYVRESFDKMGAMSGYLTPIEEFSSFNTATSLLPISSMENNLRVYLERYIGGCTSELDNTPFEAIGNGRPIVSVELGDEVNIEVESIGYVQLVGDSTQTEGISSINEAYDVNFLELHDIVEKLIGSEYGVLVNEYEGYSVNTFVDDSYLESLIMITVLEDGFIFSITKNL